MLFAVSCLECCVRMARSSVYDSKYVFESVVVQVAIVSVQVEYGRK